MTPTLAALSSHLVHLRYVRLEDLVPQPSVLQSETQDDVLASFALLKRGIEEWGWGEWLVLDMPAFNPDFLC